MTEFDYDELGLVAGLEIHQQLDTATKLFCACPTDRREPEESTRSFTRYLHPTRSELGEIDEAALEESKVEREFEYLAYDSTCLVEDDDEPPHRLDEEALEAAMEIARLLDMAAVDRAHVMRKVVIDGSNTGGFQRSSLVAEEGAIETSEGPVGVEDLMLDPHSGSRTARTACCTRWTGWASRWSKSGRSPTSRRPSRPARPPSASGCCSGRRGRSSAASGPSGRT